MSEVTNPRTGNAEKHKLVDILVIGLCAMLCGADEWKDMAQWGKEHKEWLSQHLSLEHGIPSHYTFRRVFMLLNPVVFERCVLKWIGELAGSLRGKHISVDGKALRHSYDTYHNWTYAKQD